MVLTRMVRGMGRVAFAMTAMCALATATAAAAHDVTNRVTAGFEYYGAFGDTRRFDPTRDQSHEIYPAIDLNPGPDWEVNFGVSIPLSKGVEDRRVIKLITGHRF